YRHVDDVAPEPLARELEGGARPGRVLEEEIDDGAAAQQRLLLVNLPVLLDIALGAIEQERDLVRRKALDSSRWRWGKARGDVPLSIKARTIRCRVDIGKTTLAALGAKTVARLHAASWPPE